MEKLIEYFKENHEGKNWTLFLIILGLVHSAWWFGTFDFIKEFGTQNPYFIFLEILFIASSITRILIAIDIFYIIETCPGISDCITLLWKKRRDEWRRWELNCIGQTPRIHNASFQIYRFYEACLWHWTHILYYNTNELEYECLIPNEKDRTLYQYRFRQIESYLKDVYCITYDKHSSTTTMPYHIQYWIKLEIKKCEVMIKASRNEERNIYTRIKNERNKSKINMESIMKKYDRIMQSEAYGGNYGSRIELDKLDQFLRLNSKGKKSFLDKTRIVGKKIKKYILSHVQKH